MYLNNRNYLFTSYKYLLSIHYIAIRYSLYTLNIIKFNFRYRTIRNKNNLSQKHK